MGSDKHKKEKKDKKDKKEKKDKKQRERSEKKSKKKDKSRDKSKNKDKKKDDFAKPRPLPKADTKDTKFRFDSPPKDPLQNTPFGMSKTRLPSDIELGEYGSFLPNNPLLNPQASLETLQAMTPLIQMQRLQQLRAQSDVKADRKLYVGNIPPRTIPKELQDFLNQTLLKMGVNTEAGSLCNCWIDPAGHFGFIEFRSPEEATQGFILRDVVFRGNQLKIGRPKSFLTQLAQANAVMMNSTPINPLSSFKMNERSETGSFNNFRPLRILSRYVQIPTNILVLKNVLTLDDLTIDEEYFDILEDIKEEANKFGTVKTVLIPRPDNGRIYPGVGKIYIEYQKVQEARTARRYVVGRLYGDKTIECAYLSRENWEKKQLTDLNDDIEAEREQQQQLELQEQERLRKQQYDEYNKQQQALQQQ